MTLEIAIEKQLGGFHVGLDFRCGAGLTALFGRSGAGKSSILGMIAGLTKPDRGRIVLDGRTLFDSLAGVWVPAHLRRIGYVFQDARLLPHLSVRQNLMFGRWFTPEPERVGDVNGIIDLLGVGDLLDRRPHDLSGGERQRVAIGRALLASPRLLLMDEPLASLDEQRKLEILPYIERLRDEMRVPVVYVSHAIAEVARLANEVAMISDGKLVAIGPASDILRTHHLSGPEHEADAGAMIEATIAEHDIAHELTVFETRSGQLYAPRVDLPIGSRARLRIQSRDVMIGLRQPEGISALNIMRGRILSLQPTGRSSVEIEMDCTGDRIRARLTRKSVEVLGLREGLEAFAILKSVAFDSSLIAAAPKPADSAPATKKRDW